MQSLQIPGDSFEYGIQSGESGIDDVSVVAPIVFDLLLPDDVHLLLVVIRETITAADLEETGLDYRGVRLDQSFLIHRAHELL